MPSSSLSSGGDSETDSEKQIETRAKKKTDTEKKRDRVILYTATDDQHLLQQ